jgi:hypothetical protein
VIGQTVAVPLIRDGGVNGVLAVSRARDADPFDELDLELITAVAAHTGLALQLSQTRTDSAELQRLADRDQIGGDLRQHVIHRLFNLGLGLQATAARITHPTQRAAVQKQISEVDAIIRDIRNVVFSLGVGSPEESPAVSLPEVDDPAAGPQRRTNRPAGPHPRRRCRIASPSRRTPQRWEVDLEARQWMQRWPGVWRERGRSALTASGGAAFYSGNRFGDAMNRLPVQPVRPHRQLPLVAWLFAAPHVLPRLVRSSPDVSRTTP